MNNLFNLFYNYIISMVNWNTLFLLFGLMAVVAGFNSLGYIDKLSAFLIGKTGSVRGLAFCLVFLSYFLSMLVTNDVSLIILVPFTIDLFMQTGNKDKIILIVVLETVAANIGGMLTPIGNPQNVYLYQRYEMNPGEFFMTLLPFGIMVFVLLCVTLILGIKNTKLSEGSSVLEAWQEDEEISKAKKTLQTIVFSVLFIICLLSVFRLIPNVVSFVLSVIAILACNIRLIKRINFGLLWKFVLLFILVGNVANIPAIESFLSNLVSGNEFLCGVLISQVVSNVPAAILLSDFTANGLMLLLGVNIGGLGTLIASMASMISLDYYGKSEEHTTGKYIGIFTLINVLYLLIMVGLYFIIY